MLTSSTPPPILMDRGTDQTSPDGKQARRILNLAVEGTPLPRDVSLPILLRALQQAIAWGGLVTAKTLAAQVPSDGWGLHPKQHRALASALIDTHIAWGESETALKLASIHASSLAGTKNAVDLLVNVLGEVSAPNPPLILADGRLDTFTASRRLEAGALRVSDLCDLVRRQRCLLFNPEVDLLLASAHLPNSSARTFECLNGYLACHRLPPLAPIQSSPLCWPNLRSRVGLSPVDGPLVSILMAARNCQLWVQSAIQSLLEQNYRNLEILVCDDGSSDGTRQTLQQCFGTEPRVRLFVSECNQGPYNIRNALLEHARGEFITFHDADDYALPTRISLQVRTMLERDSSAVISDWIRVRPSGSVVFFRDLRATRLCLVSLMVRRSICQTVGAFRRARFGADFEWYQRLCDIYGTKGVARIRSPLLFGMWSGASLTRQAGTESLETGYRSVSRLRFSELSFRQRLLGDGALFPDHVDRELQASSNFASPASIRPLTPA